MAAPVEARRVLFPLYAFNVEIARAPWVTEEPLIAEMRLQWWRDALEEISEGRPVRKHEVTTPLAETLQRSDAEALDEAVQSRRWDIYRDAFEDEDHFETYLRNTGGLLMWTAARSLGAETNSAEPVLALGSATALVRFLQAVPALEARGRIPLVDGREEAIKALATASLERLPERKSLRKSLPHSAMAALLEGWQTKPLLKQIASDPARVGRGAIGLSEFRRRARLIRWAI